MPVGASLMQVHRDVNAHDAFEIFGMSMERGGAGKLELRTDQGLGPYEQSIAAWKEGARIVDHFVEFCNLTPLEEFGESFAMSGSHPYRYWPGIKAVVKKGDVALFVKILKEIVDHREDLQNRVLYGYTLSHAQTRMLKFLNAILVSPMKAAGSCWMNLIRCMQRNKAGVYDQPYTKKGLDHYSLEQQELLMSPSFLATAVKV